MDSSLFLSRSWSWPWGQLSQMWSASHAVLPLSTWATASVAGLCWDLTMWKWGVDQLPVFDIWVHDILQSIQWIFDNHLSPSLSFAMTNVTLVPDLWQGDRMPVFSYEWGWHILHLWDDEGKEQYGVAVQQALHLHFCLPIHLHGA